MATAAEKERLRAEAVAERDQMKRSRDLLKSDRDHILSRLRNALLNKQNDARRLSGGRDGGRAGTRSQDDLEQERPRRTSRSARRQHSPTVSELPGWCAEDGTAAQQSRAQQPSTSAAHRATPSSTHRATPSSTEPAHPTSAELGTNARSPAEVEVQLSSRLDALSVLELSAFLQDALSVPAMEGLPPRFPDICVAELFDWYEKHPRPPHIRGPGIGAVATNDLAASSSTPDEDGPAPLEQRLEAVELDRYLVDQRKLLRTQAERDVLKLEREEARAEVKALRQTNQHKDREFYRVVQKSRREISVLERHCSQLAQRGRGQEPREAADVELAAVRKQLTNTQTERDLRTTELAAVRRELAETQTERNLRTQERDFARETAEKADRFANETAEELLKDYASFKHHAEVGVAMSSKEGLIPWVCSSRSCEMNFPSQVREELLVVWTLLHIIF